MNDDERFINDVCAAHIINEMFLEGRNITLIMAKVKVIKKTMKDPELADMFNQMLGTSEPDPNIIIPKYKDIMTKTSSVLKLFNSLVAPTHPFFITFNDDFNKAFDELRAFIKDGYLELKAFELEENNNVLTGEQLNELNKNPEKFQEFLASASSRYKVQNLQKRWMDLKESRIVQEMIVSARNIKAVITAEQKRTSSATHDLETKGELRENFIINADGDFLTIFQFCSFDFKQIFLSPKINADLKKYILLFLHIVYKEVIAVVNIITSPDIDIEKFAVILIERLEDFKKQIPRCDLAFKKISESVDLLKNNFGQYYKDFIVSRDNPSIMIEHFIMDVSNNCGSNIKLIAQFREIMRFIGKNMNQNKVNDPRMKKMFDLLSNNLELLEKETGKKGESSTANEKKETTSRKRKS